MRKPHGPIAARHRVGECPLQRIKCLPRRIGTRSHRVAFTLVEMLVSLAVLTVALSVVGAVFGITTRAAGQSAAYAEVQGYLRQFAAQFEADLRGVDPARSILVMIGRSQAAALTADDLTAERYFRTLVGDPNNAPSGYQPEYDTGDPNISSNSVFANPRADLLMFFTNRAVPSIAPPLAPNLSDAFSVAAARGAALGPVQVVYGHGALGAAVWNGNRWLYPNTADLQHVQRSFATRNDLSELPSTRWLLARRQVIIDPATDPSQLTFDVLSGFDPGVYPRIVNADASLTVGWPGDAAKLHLGEFLRDLSPSGTSPAALLIPYGFRNVVVTFPAWPLALQQRFERLIFADDNARQLGHFATLIENPPADLRSNMGMQLVPGCVEFKVEFLLPEDVRNSTAFRGRPLDPNMSLPTDPPAWCTIRPGDTYAFAPDSAENRGVILDQARDGIDMSERLAGYTRLDQNTLKHDVPVQPINPADPLQLNDVADSINQRVIRLWPYAIRVTVRAIDARGRLPEPVMRSFVHRFPE